MEFGRPGPEPRLDEVLLLIQRPQEVRPGLGGVPEHHSWGRLGPRATQGLGGLSPCIGFHPP